MAGDDQASRGSARLWFALVLAVALGVAIVVLSTSGGEEEATAAAAPPECLSEWNRDVAARENGRHSRAFHRYDEAQVGYADLSAGEAGAVFTDPDGGPCAVVFPRSALDPEIEFAGFYSDAGGWRSLSEEYPESVLSALQAEAISAANATLTDEGGLEAG